MKIACLVSILKLHTVILSGAKDLEIVRRPALSGTPQNDKKQVSGWTSFNK